MIHLFIDTDIILDFLGERKPFSKFALQMFLKAGKEELKLYASGNSITTSYYILCKYTDEKTARRLVIELLNYLTVIPVNAEILSMAFKSSFKDVEDAVQHFCALTQKEISSIITRNVRDYKHSQISVRTPEEIMRSVL